MSSRPGAIALVRNLAAWHTMQWTHQLERCDTIIGTITEPEQWSEDAALNNLRGIFHLAAVVRHSRRQSADVYRTNVDGTLEMVRVAARHGCRMIFVSTSGTVGCFHSPGQSADEEAPYCEREVAKWPYYHSKILAEKKARMLAEELGVELVVVRPPLLLGPGDHRFRSSAHVLRYLRRKLPFLIRGGMHFADVRDVARALVRAMELSRVRPVYHLPGTVCSIEEFFALAADVSGVPSPRRVVPNRLAWWLASAFERVGVFFKGEPLQVLPASIVIEMASRYWATSSKYAEAHLDYRNRHPRETLSDTIDWLRANHPSLTGGPGRTRR